MLVPSGHARGPWDPEAQHGGPPAALIARAAEALDAPGPMLLSRMTVEFLGAVPMAPLEVRSEVVRPGRRLQLAEISLWSEGQELCRARVVRIRREPVTVPQRALPPARLPPPEALETEQIPVPPHGSTEGFGRTGIEMRFAAGTFVELGPATAWFRLRVPLVAGEEPSPEQRAMAAADFGNGLAAELRFDTHLFVNTELTVHLFREPVGEWIAVEGRTEHGPEGTAVAASVLHDVRGPIGHAAQALYVAER